MDVIFWMIIFAQCPISMLYQFTCLHFFFSDNPRGLFFQRLSRMEIMSPVRLLFNEPREWQQHNGSHTQRAARLESCSRAEQDANIKQKTTVTRVITRQPSGQIFFCRELWAMIRILVLYYNSAYFYQLKTVWEDFLYLPAAGTEQFSAVYTQEEVSNTYRKSRVKVHVCKIGNSNEECKDLLRVIVSL